MLKTIRSGLQRGVDKAALDAALTTGYETASWMPKGYRTQDENGRDVYRPDYAEKYGARETDSFEWDVRTRLNVRDADATLVLSTVFPLGRGSNLTVREAQRKGKLFEAIWLYPLAGDLVPERLYCPRMNLIRRFSAPAPVRLDYLVHWLSRYETVNIAGNRDADENAVKAWLTRLFEQVKGIG